MADKRQEDRFLSDAFKWAGVGVEFCGVMALFSYFGYKLDEYFKTSPWLLVTGFFIGFAGMLYILIRRSL